MPDDYQLYGVLSLGITEAYTYAPINFVQSLYNDGRIDAPKVSFSFSMNGDNTESYLIYGSTSKCTVSPISGSKSITEDAVSVSTQANW